MEYCIKSSSFPDFVLHFKSTTVYLRIAFYNSYCESTYISAPMQQFSFFWNFLFFISYSFSSSLFISFALFWTNTMLTTSSNTSPPFFQSLLAKEKFRIITQQLFCFSDTSQRCWISPTLLGPWLLQHLLLQDHILLNILSNNSPNHLRCFYLQSVLYIPYLPQLNFLCHC
jgi:hypothetical protein